MESNSNSSSSSSNDTTPPQKKSKLGKLNTITLILSIVYFITLYISIAHPENATRIESINNNNNKEFLKDFHQSSPKKVTTNAFDQNNTHNNKAPSSPILTAYLETINQDEWKIKPLPIRSKNAQSTKLKKITYPNLQSCKNLPSQWPVDNYPDDDPFLPWIHDVFPSNDGKVITFIAQNKRRCHTGKDYDDVKKHMSPQVSLFQHVPIKRIFKEDDEIRYKLTSHEHADFDGVHTRFICKFKNANINIETLSTFHVDYDYATFRKRGGHTTTFNENAKDFNNLWTSQLIFHCPAPKELQDIIKNGDSVINDYATIFLDLIPIRTPPRYIRSDDFLQPKYGIPNKFNATYEFGDNHILPLIKDSGRWENIPICKPSLLTYFESKNDNPSAIKMNNNDDISSSSSSTLPNINHTLVAFTWTSKSFQTRKSATLSDGERRLKEWLTFHIMVGFDHIYVYDNTHAFDNTTSLQSVISTFPSNKVTRINWPSKICNNNPGGKDDRGERSSQYAAESSCLMRFGVHSKWISMLDTDEYLIPMGRYTDMRQLLAKLEEQDVKIYTFNSFRTRPIISRFEPPKAVQCFGKRRCFQPIVPNNSSFLHAYNCESEKPPKRKTVPAEKQIYRTDYVLLHFIHYSVTTTDTMKTLSELNVQDAAWTLQRYQETKERVSDEINEATMIHTKTVPYEHTTNFEFLGKHLKSYFGFPWPDGTESKDNITNVDGFLYNCFINDNVESYWLPKLHKALGIIN